MSEKAILKLRQEMDSNHSKPYIQVIGEFLLQHVRNHPQDAEKIMAEDKTIAGSLQSMRNEAQKRNVNGCAILTDQEGFAIVLRYFGIDGTMVDTKQEDTAAVVTHSVPKAEPVKRDSGFSVSLDDLL